MSFIYDIDARDNSGEVLWSVNDSDVEISESGVVRNTTSLTSGNYSYRVTISDPSGNSRSATLQLEVLAEGPNKIADSYINQTFYSDTNQLIGGPETLIGSSIIDSSNTTESNITTSRVNISRVDFSIVQSCTLFDSQISDSSCKGSVLENLELDNSTSIDSEIENSTLNNSKTNRSVLKNSTAVNSTIKNSTIENSTIEDVTAEDSDLSDGKINEGCLNYSGDSYCSDDNDIEDDIDIILENRPPDPEFTVEKLGEMNYRFNASKSSDPDGSIDSYNWTIRGLNEVNRSGEVVEYEFQYDSSGSPEVTLKVQDNVGNVEKVSKVIEVSAKDSGGSGGGGGGSGGFTGEIGEDAEEETDMEILNLRLAEAARPGEAVVFNVSIENTGAETEAYLVLESESLQNRNISLTVPEDQTVVEKIEVSKAETGIYTGSVVLRAGDFSESIPLELNVTDNETALENFEIESRPNRSNLNYSLDLPELNEFETVNLTLRDPSNGKVIASKDEILADSQGKVEGNFSGLEKGTYQLVAELEGERSLSTSRIVQVEGEEKSEKGFSLIPLIILIAVTAVAALAGVYILKFRGSTDEMSKREIKKELEELREELVKLEVDQSERIVEKLKRLDESPELLEDLLIEVADDVEEDNFAEAKLDLDKIEELLDRKLEE
jgi:hypothetical protein